MILSTVMGNVLLLTFGTLNITRPDVANLPASADLDSHYLREGDIVKLVLLAVGSINSQIPCSHIAAFLAHVVKCNPCAVSAYYGSI